MLDLFLGFLVRACAFVPSIAVSFALADTRRPFGQKVARAFFVALKVGLPIALLLAGFGTWFIVTYMAPPN